ncbi:transcription cofactor vestigial-like protein 1 isoform X2 [Anabas testudineus]|nr:transcription cofactor vestigial-like protein 1 isoform X2 [Anabas testudineus]XP_026212842.1 transcription cofactor vestigial-like protein 1 isoform X2 [Anabas testudineus]
MEDRSENPISVKVEEHSQYVVLTYFQGDISSMVDAHFTRALNKDYKTKAPAAKTKKIRKSIKLEDASPCQSSPVDSYIDSQVPPPSGHLLTFNSLDSAPWPSLNSRAGEGPALPSIAYSLPPEGLSLTGQQYATSLLNLLHSDRGAEMGPSMPSSMPSSSKPELLPTWAPTFRESTDSLNAVGFEHGRRLDKKDLYWY